MNRSLAWQLTAIVFGLCFLSTMTWWVPFGVVLTSLGEVSDDLAFPLSSAVLAHDKAQWGPDVLFTYGPLGYLASFGLFQKQQVFFLAYRAAFSATTAMLLWTLCDRFFRQLWARLIALSLLACLLFMWAIGWSESFWVAPPFAICVLALNSSSGADRNTRVLVYLAAMLLGPAALIKFSFTVIYVGIFGLLGVHDVVTRRLPTASLLFLASVVTSWVLAGQAIGNLPLWLWYSLDLSAGYSDAMSGGFWQPYRLRVALSLYLACALLVVVPLFSRNGALKTYLLTAAALGIALVTVQHSFGGNQIEISVLVLIMAALIFGFAGSTRSRIVAGASVAVSLFVLANTSARSIGQPSLIAWNFDHAIRALTGKYQDVEQNRKNLYSSIQRLVRLPDGAKGSMDIYTRKTAIALAQEGVAYNPRPAFLSINAHTERLATVNANFLGSTRAPEFLAFDDALSEPVNARYPSTNDGPSWPIIWSHYQQIDEQNGVLLYQRRAAPLTVNLNATISRRVVVGSDIKVEQTGMVWATVDLRKTILGSLIANLYKAPRAFINVKYADGSTRQFQLVPALGRAGFLLSPTISNTAEFAQQSGPKVESFFISVEPGLGWLYEPESLISMSQLIIGRPTEINDADLRRGP